MLNHIAIMGRLARDPELRRTGSGIAVANFSVAVERDFKDGNGEKKADFIDCVAWRQAGEFVAKYFKKGAMIALTGRLEMRDWVDKNGNKRISAEINADRCYFGGGKSDGEAKRYEYDDGTYQSPGGNFVKDSGFPVLVDDDEQLPF